MTTYDLLLASRPEAARVRDSAMGSRLERARRRLADHPVACAVVLVALSAAIALAIAGSGGAKWRDDVRTAVVTLVFGALIGGVVKLLLDDVQTRRAQRTERVRWIRAVLDDLKNVYDVVERARTLIIAHRSALTYGNEMRNLIDARVKLKNVRRAVESTPRAVDDDKAGTIRRSVGTMDDYLDWLGEEFEQRYRAISEAQTIYEARRQKAIEALTVDGPEPSVENAPWRMIESLERARAFLGFCKAPAVHDYGVQFREPLDEASAALRAELARALGHSA